MGSVSVLSVGNFHVLFVLDCPIISGNSSITCGVTCFEPLVVCVESIALLLTSKLAP